MPLTTIHRLEGTGKPMISDLVTFSNIPGLNLTDEVTFSSHESSPDGVGQITTYWELSIIKSAETFIPSNPPVLNYPPGVRQGRPIKDEPQG